MSLSQWKDVAEIASSLMTAGAIVAGLIWFLYTRSFRRRVQFEVDLQLIDLGPENPNYLAEVMLIIENKGPREHRIYNLFARFDKPSNWQAARSFALFSP